MPHHHSRGWPGEPEIMGEIEQDAGSQLAALSSLLIRSVQEIDEAAIPKDLGGHRLPLILIFATAISSLDSVRILPEHGNAEQAHALTRTLYDAEIDVALLSADPDLVGRYSDFELFDPSRTPGRAAERGLFDDVEDAEDAIADRKEEIRQALERADLEVSEDFDDMTLLEAAQELGRRRFGNSNPPTWRPEMPWSKRLDMVIPVQFQALRPDLDDASPEYEEWEDTRRAEHEVAFSEMSARLHCSPQITALRWPDFQVGGSPADVGRIAYIAASHFLRIHHTVCNELEIPCDRSYWADLYGEAEEVPVTSGDT